MLTTSLRCLYRNGFRRLPDDNVRRLRTTQARLGASTDSDDNAAPRILFGFRAVNAGSIL